MPRESVKTRNADILVLVIFAISTTTMDNLNSDALHIKINITINLSYHMITEVN